MPQSGSGIEIESDVAIKFILYLYQNGLKSKMLSGISYGALAKILEVPIWQIEQLLLPIERYTQDAGWDL